VFLETGLPSFDTVVHNGAYTFARTWKNCPNVLVDISVLVCSSVFRCMYVFLFICVNVYNPLGNLNSGRSPESEAH